jgi:hypothetical protein
MAFMSIVAVPSKVAPLANATLLRIAIENLSSRNIPLKAEYDPVAPSCNANVRPN